MQCEDAMRLLLERREAARNGDADRVVEIDEERWAHDPNGDKVCDCWKKAIRIMDAVINRAA